MEDLEQSSLEEKVDLGNLIPEQNSKSY